MNVKEERHRFSQSLLFFTALCTGIMNRVAKSATAWVWL